MLEFFKFKGGSSYQNEVTTKDTSKDNTTENDSDVYENIYSDKETYSHYNFTK